MLKRLYIFGLVIKLTLFFILFYSNIAAANQKSALEEEFNKAKETYNQQQKIYIEASKKYEQQMKQISSFEASQEQQEEYINLLKLYKQQQKDYYKLSELEKQLKEELINNQSPFKLLFLGIGIICFIPAITSLLIGIVLLYIFKKPFGRKLAEFGALPGTICVISLLLAKKYYYLAFAGIIVALIFSFFYKKRKII